MVDGTSNCQHRFESRRGKCRDGAAQGNGDRLALHLRELPSRVALATLTGADSLRDEILLCPPQHIAPSIAEALPDFVMRRSGTLPVPAIDRADRNLEQRCKIRDRQRAFRHTTRYFARFLHFSWSVLSRRAGRVGARPERCHAATVRMSARPVCRSDKQRQMNRGPCDHHALLIRSPVMLSTWRSSS